MAGVFAVQGFNYPSWWSGTYRSPASDATVAAVAGTGANAIAIVPTVFLDDASATVFRATEQTEDAAGLGHAIRQAHAAGLSVMLKPHVDLLSGGWRGALAPADVGAWFAGYKAVLLDYARIAEATGVETLCIGTELRTLTGAAYRSEWSDLIAAVRGVYSGRLTYAANWDEVRTVSFWDKLDLIGADAYVPLTAKADPTVQELIDGWLTVPLDPQQAALQDHKSAVDFLRDLALRYGKPVLFTELGYRSIDGANIDPSEWETPGRFDGGEQADLFRAFFEVWSEHGGGWFAGVHIWNWQAPDAAAGAMLDYTPQGKPAATVIAEWFGGVRTAPPLVRTGSPAADRIDGAGNDDRLSGGPGNDAIEGRDGDDVIAGGPDAPGRLAETRVVVTATADAAEGMGALMTLLVNGRTVGGPVEVGPATAPGGYTTAVFTFVNPDRIDSLAVAFINDLRTTTEDRNLHIKGIEVNGARLSLAEATAPRTWSLWSDGAVAYDMRARQDLFFGAASDDDRLWGGAGRDRLDGGAGADLLEGGRGADTVAGGAGTDTASYAGSPEGVDVQLGRAAQSGGDAAGDALLGIENLTGSAFADRLTGDVGANRLDGGARSDRLTGGAGDDLLIGGAGIDRMAGGPGNDTYYADAAGDAAVEAAGGGTDMVIASADFSLAALPEVENLTLSGAAAAGEGNAAANRIRGNAGADSLSGGAGNDVLIGGAGDDRLEGGPGNDILYVDSPGDRTVETPGNGIDTEAASVSRTLAPETENLVLTGGAALDGRGNALANVMTGNAGANRLEGLGGADRLNGGAGDDLLAGGAGADRFVFADGAGADRILDFAAGPGAGDVIDLRADAQIDGFADLLARAQQAGADCVIDLGGADRLTLVGIAKARLAADDFLF